MVLEECDPIATGYTSVCDDRFESAKDITITPRKHFIKIF